MIKKCEVCNIAFATEQYASCPLCKLDRIFKRYKRNTKIDKRFLLDNLAFSKKKTEWVKGFTIEKSQEIDHLKRLLKYCLEAMERGGTKEGFLYKNIKKVLEE